MEEKMQINKRKKNCFFKKFTVKDIVFLAIISAVMLLTCGVMPLALGLPFFGMPQLFTVIQTALFMAIALEKVQKQGSLFLVALFSGFFFIMMNPVVFIGNIIISIVLELLVFLIFGGFKKPTAVFIATALYIPLSLPFGFLYHFLINKQSALFIVKDKPIIAVLISLLVLVLSCFATWAGMKIAKELKKNGVLRREREE